MIHTDIIKESYSTGDHNHNGEKNKLGLYP